MFEDVWYSSCMVTRKYILKVSVYAIFCIVLFGFLQDSQVNAEWTNVEFEGSCAIVV